MIFKMNSISIEQSAYKLTLTVKYVSILRYNDFDLEIVCVRIVITLLFEV